MYLYMREETGYIGMQMWRQGCRSFVLSQSTRIIFGFAQQ